MIVLAGAAMCWSGSTWAASLAGSDAARHWDQLHDARLVHAADGTPEVAARLYEELLENLGPGDPMRAEVNYWLGRARLELDDLDGAARALSTASKDEAIGPRARALLSVTESRRRQVEKLPARWTFESGTHNLVRGGTRRPSGELAIRRAGEAVALAWPTEVEDGDPDALVVGLGPGVTFRAFEARARSTQFPAVLRLLALDSTGRRWASPVIAVPADRWVDIEVALADLAALDGRSPPLRRADRLALEDVTASASGDRGANVVLLDYVAIR